MTMHSASPQPSRSVPSAQANNGLTRIVAIADHTGRAIVELAGFLHKIDADAREQLTIVDGMSTEARDLARIGQEMSAGLGAVAETNASALACVEDSVNALQVSSQESQKVAGWVGGLDDQLAQVQDTLDTVRRVNTRIAQIAKQVNILAVNARIEAARAGDMGRGFAVVAEAIGALSKETSAASLDVTSSTGTLSTLLSGLRQDAKGVVDSAAHVMETSSQADTALTTMNDQVRQAASDSQELTEHAHGIAQAVQDFAPKFEGLARALTHTAKGVHTANSQAEEVIDIAEEAVQVTVELGGAAADGVLIEIVQEQARVIGATFEAALDQGDISHEALFSSQYTPIPGTDPEQVRTPFSDFTDRVLPPLQEPLLARDTRIVFCVAVDRNGYLPTHNAKFSHPQGDDPVWNAANCRNRRVFNDRVGLKAGRNTAPFLMQTYRRDMGGGQFVLMKDLSAPVFVNGHHWGGVRMGFAPAAA